MKSSFSSCRKRFSVERESDASQLRQLFGHKQHGSKGNLPTHDSNAKITFFDTYRNLGKIRQKLTLKKGKSSPAIAILAKEHENLLSPMPLGLLKGRSRVIDLKRYSLSDQYADVFSNGLREHTSVERVNLKGSKLSESGSATILKNLNLPSLVHLDISDNRLGDLSVFRLAQILESSHSELKRLSLEATRLSLKGIVVICQAIEGSRKVRLLNLARNSIKDDGAFVIGNMLKSNTSLTALDLHWNMINSEGASSLFSGLAENAHLLQFDLSWNSLGSSPIEMAQSMASCIRTNQTLRHLDISFNSLTAKYCEIIGEALLYNHTVLGMHVRGNACKIDTLGFLHIAENNDFGRSANSYRRMLGSDKPSVRENCWVCEKWIETTIIFPHFEKTLFLHTELEDYKPFIMERDRDGYILRRVLPYRQFDIFFTDTTAASHVLPAYQIKYLKPIAKNIEYTTNTSYSVLVSEVNVIMPEGIECDIKDPFETIPRPNNYNSIDNSLFTGEKDINDPHNDSREQPKRKKQWRFTESLFKDYQIDTPELLDKCFKYD